MEAFNKWGNECKSMEGALTFKHYMMLQWCHGKSFYMYIQEVQSDGMCWGEKMFLIHVLFKQLE